ncbi:MAG: alcohol dehydrogenase catalytic domain-containing protein [Spirochaetota bacterium]|nr:MAG: alcohol dehydrogenase catalytic domain-containing protein [Spirochaetota bacterium]
MDNSKRYRDLKYKIPEQSQAWRIYGKGMENFGDKNGSGKRHPSLIPIPEPKDDEILVRSDAVGLCFSDTKIIKLGPDHPRLKGRNMKEEPVIPGHEVALTIVKAGKKWKKRYKPGQKYIIQADVYYKGRISSYGYVIPGGLSQYGILGTEVLEGDAGSYLIPIKNKNICYSQAALVEPWACVVAAYRIKHRDGIKPDGSLLLLGNGKDEKEWSFDNLFQNRAPKSVCSIRLGKKTKTSLLSTLQNKTVSISSNEDNIETAKEHFTEGFDDIIILGDINEEILTKAADSMCPYGIMNYMAGNTHTQMINIDVGKIHYDRISFIGSLDNDVNQPYTGNLDYSLKGDSILLLGAGGPMGQMHIHLAIERDPPPEVVIATDIAKERLNALESLFRKRAEQRGIRFTSLNPKEFRSQDEYRNTILKNNNKKLFDYVICLAAIPAVIEEASSYLAERSILNIFAGVSKGTLVNLNIKDVVTKTVKWIGHSGSGIEDMEYALRMVESGELNTNISVAGVSGINDVWNGIEAVRTGLFPGKIVIYPQIEHMDLITIGDLKKRYPKVGAYLGKDDRWTEEAERQLFDDMLNLR